MGSLMAGWNSHVHDAKSATYKRNRSFTKEEIEAYWTAKKKTEEEHLRAISSPLSDSSQKNMYEETGRRLERSRTLPLANTTKEDFMDLDTKPSLDKLIKKDGWWTRSSSAFLNEPPVLASEGSTSTYAPQFHVAAKLGATRDGISA